MERLVFECVFCDVFDIAQVREYGNREWGGGFCT